MLSRHEAETKHAPRPSTRKFDESVWELRPNTPNLDVDELGRWTRARVGMQHEAKLNRWTKVAASAKLGIPASTFSLWYDGTYTGDFARYNAVALAYLDKAQAMREAAIRAPLDPGFVETPTAREIFAVFTAAMSLPAIAMVTCGAGVGKTTAARAYEGRYPRVFIATMKPSITTPERAIREVARSLGIDIAGYQGMVKALAGRFAKGSDNVLLIIDEAQFLGDGAVNEIRLLHDMYGIGLVLLGNEEFYARYTSGGGLTIQAQIRRRIGWRFKRMENAPEDIAMILDAWGLEDDEMRSLCARIARKPGKLGTMVETIRLAHILAAGHERDVTAEDIRDAWTNRSDGSDRL